jgi:hypothetical protein
MLGQIASRRHALRLGAFAALAGGLVVAGCATTTTVSGTASGATNTVTVTPAEVAAQASVVLTAVCGAVTAFIASNPSGVSSTILSQIALAETSASTAITALSSANLSSVPAAAVTVANTIVSVVTMIPGLPPAVIAGAIAFQILAAALEPVLTNITTTTLGAMPLQAGMPVRPGVTRVLLVPNH